MEETKIALFNGKQIRKVIYNNEWWFSVVDIIEALTESTQASKYWRAMEARTTEEEGIQLSTIWRQLKLLASDVKSMKPTVPIPKGSFALFNPSLLPRPNRSSVGLPR